MFVRLPENVVFEVLLTVKVRVPVPRFTVAAENVRSPAPFTVADEKLDLPAAASLQQATLGMPVGAIGPTRARCLEKLRKKLENLEFFG